MFKTWLSLFLMVCFFLTGLTPPCPQAKADMPNLPAPGTMINLSPAYEPVIIKGLTVHKDNPLLFDFIVDPGQDLVSGPALKKEGEKLIKYFLAGLAIPDRDLWVNLSPYERNKIIPQALGRTDMGRDLLEEDYILKQITASLIYPERKLGKTFWNEVYSRARAEFGTTQIPVDTFNKVWIMADRAEVFEHNQTAFVVDRHLKVMLEEDYLSLAKHQGKPGDTSLGDVSPGRFPSKEAWNGKTPQENHGIDTPGHSMASQIVREIVLPELEHEVNTGKNFAPLRQIFNSVILSSWYKNRLKEALLNRVYANKSKINGIHLNDPAVKQRIYEQYLKAYKKGVFNYIKEDIDSSGQPIPRKYFSGGITALAMKVGVTNDLAMMVAALPSNPMDDFVVLASPQRINPSANSAMITSHRPRMPLTVPVDSLSFRVGGGTYVMHVGEAFFSPIENSAGKIIQIRRGATQVTIEFAPDISPSEPAVFNLEYGPGPEPWPYKIFNLPRSPEKPQVITTNDWLKLEQYIRRWETRNRSLLERIYQVQAKNDNADLNQKLKVLSGRVEFRGFSFQRQLRLWKERGDFFSRNDEVGDLETRTMNDEQTLDFMEGLLENGVLALQEDNKKLKGRIKETQIKLRIRGNSEWNVLLAQVTSTELKFDELFESILKGGRKGFDAKRTMRDLRAEIESNENWFLVLMVKEVDRKLLSVLEMVLPSKPAAPYFGLRQIRKDINFREPELERPAYLISSSTSTLFILVEAARRDLGSLIGLMAGISPAEVEKLRRFKKFFDVSVEDFSRMAPLRKTAGFKKENLIGRSRGIDGGKMPVVSDRASLAKPPGGIDLNTSNGMRWKISRDGKGVEMNIDPAMVERFRREGVSWLSPKILKVVPIADIWSLVGIQPPAAS